MVLKYLMDENVDLSEAIKNFWQQIGIYLYSNGGVFYF
jgi:hypothetical protein